MRGRTRSFVAGIILLGVATVWFLAAHRKRPEALVPAEATARTVEAPLSPPTAAPAALAASGSSEPAGPERVQPATPQAGPAPDQEGDLSSWRSAKFAFTFRELGAMGPYVKVALDGARGDMAFCFDQADAPDPDAPRDPAVLLLYLEGREGALDVVDARAERLGTRTPEIVECCRQVLRGLEIPAFKAVPGQRYRLRFQLD